MLRAGILMYFILRDGLKYTYVESLDTKVYLCLELGFLSIFMLRAGIQKYIYFKIWDTKVY